MMTPAEQHNLLIGTPSKVFTDGPVPMRICKNIFEGITIAQQKCYDTIYLVHSDLPEPRTQAIEALHQVCPDASIRLLIEMGEEPAVCQWLRMSSWTGGLLDYMICPISVKSLTLAKAVNNTADIDIEDRNKDQRIQELETLVMQDDLTGLKNRRYLRQFLPSILQKAKAGQCQVTLLLFDIDDFNQVLPLRSFNLIIDPNEKESRIERVSTGIERYDG